MPWAFPTDHTVGVGGSGEAGGGGDVNTSAGGSGRSREMPWRRAANSTHSTKPAVNTAWTSGASGSLPSELMMVVPSEPLASSKSATTLFTTWNAIPASSPPVRHTTNAKPSPMTPTLSRPQISYCVCPTVKITVDTTMPTQGFFTQAPMVCMTRPRNTYSSAADCSGTSTMMSTASSANRPASTGTGSMGTPKRGPGNDSPGLRVGT